MNILVFGAGAIGSLFGGILSKNNNVVLIGRKKHVEAINKKDLEIKDLTNFNANVKAFENIEVIPFKPDIVIISVKSYDTGKAAKTIKKIIDKNTVVISLQNGLDNIEKIEKHVDKKQIVICITTHGSVFSKPGIISHTGVGKTIVGTVENNNQNDLEKIARILTKAGIKTKVSTNILKDMWAKAIANSSINPLTAIFNCKNGYLMKNPVLEQIVESVCKESTDIANAYGYNLSYDEMIDKTRKVISETENNFSSMLQSVKKNKITEINSINGIFVKLGDKKGVGTNLNKMLVRCIGLYS